MSSSLTQFALELAAQMNDPALDDRVVTTRRAFENLRSAPRVGIVEVGGPITYPDRVGEAVIEPGVKARIIGLRNRTVQVYCHGQTEEQAEQLLGNTLAAARAVLHNSMQFGAEEWVDQQPGADGFVKHGRLVMWELTWITPVYDVQRPLTVLQGFDETETFADEEIPCDE